jgi:hypothetical protein
MMVRGAVMGSAGIGAPGGKANHLVECVTGTDLQRDVAPEPVCDVAAVAAAFFFTLLAALVADAYRDMRWSDIVNRRE